MKNLLIQNTILQNITRLSNKTIRKCYRVKYDWVGDSWVHSSLPCPILFHVVSVAVNSPIKQEKNKNKQKEGMKRIQVRVSAGNGAQDLSVWYEVAHCCHRRCVSHPPPAESMCPLPVGAGCVHLLSPPLSPLWFHAANEGINTQLTFHTWCFILVI